MLKHTHLCPLILIRVLVLICPVGLVCSQEQASKTVAKREAYVVPFSHLDLFWAGTREECLARGNRIIAKALNIARQHPDFRFLIESNNFLLNFAQSHPGSPELDELKSLAREGRFEIAPNWADIFLNLPDGEVLARNFLFGTHYARNVFGADPQVFHPGDIPGFSPQIPQLLKQSRVPYMVMTRMGPLDRLLFNWQSPDGSKTLVWSAPHGYAWGVFLNLHGEMSEQNVSAVREQVEQASAAAPGPVLLHWGLDLWAPTDMLMANVDRLNHEIPSTHFSIATPVDFFHVASRVSDVPTLSGDIPMAWPHVIDSIGHLWQLAVPATNRLELAEKFSAINYALGYANYPQEHLEALWKLLIESMDHNHDGQGGEIGDMEKMQDSQHVSIEGGEILRDMLRNIAERVQLPIKRSTPIVVFNGLGWKRDDIVRAHVTLYGDVSPAAIDDYKRGMRLVDERGKSVPFYIEETSDNISRALEIIFAAEGVPSLGYKTYFLVPTDQPETLPTASSVTLDRDNDVKDPRRPLGKDIVENQFYRLTIDKATGEVTIFDKELSRDVSADLEMVGVEERGTNNVQREIKTGRTLQFSINSTELEENNAVPTVFRIAGVIADIPIIQRLTLYRNLKRVDIENSLDWKEPRFLNIEQLIPVPRNAEAFYGIPFGATAVKDVLPGSGPRAQDEISQDDWRKYRTIQSWVSADTADWGMTIAADHQLVQVEDGLVRAAMIRGQRYTSVRVVRGDEITSVHFPAKGHYVFRFSLSSGDGDWKARLSFQAGMGFNSPLVPISVLDDLSPKTLPPTYSFLSVNGDNLVISVLKESESGPTIILRGYEIEGASVETPVTFLGIVRRLRATNLVEEDAENSDQQVLRLKPFEIKTVRLSLAIPERIAETRH